MIGPWGLYRKIVSAGLAVVEAIVTSIQGAYEAGYDAGRANR